MPPKGTMGIVGCYGLSDQILHLIEEDEHIRTLFLVANEEGKQFARKAKERSSHVEPVMVDQNAIRAKGKEGFSVLLWLNSEGLHDGRDIDRHHREILSRIAGHVDSVLFCYGLCRSPEQRLIELKDEASVPMTFLTDLDGEIVDDCFAAVIGGKRDYLEHIMGHKHTLLATSGYAESWRRKRERADLTSLVEEVEGLRYMFETLGYHKLLKLDDYINDGGRFDEDVRAFSQLFDLELEVKQCHSRVFEHSYALAKESMQDESNGDSSSTTAPRSMARPSCMVLKGATSEEAAMADRRAASLNRSCLPDSGALSRTLP
jgi:hypothetical protein